MAEVKKTKTEEVKAEVKASPKATVKKTVAKKAETKAAETKAAAPKKAAKTTTAKTTAAKAATKKTTAKKAAAENVQAINMLGFYYAVGFGVEQDLNRAVRYFKLADEIYQSALHRDAIDCLEVLRKAKMLQESEKGEKSMSV